MIELFLKMMEFDFETVYLCITPVKEYLTHTIHFKTEGD